MKLTLICVAILASTTLINAVPMDGDEEKQMVVNKLQEILAELEGDTEADPSKMEGHELMADIDINDMNLDDFKENGDEFILDSDKTADLLEEFRQAMGNQPPVPDEEQDEIYPLNSESMAQPEQDEGEEEIGSRREEDMEEGVMNDVDVETAADPEKMEGHELMEDVDISDMNLNDFKENGDEFILDSDKTADLLEEFRQAMGNQHEVPDDEQEEIYPLNSDVNHEARYGEDNEEDIASNLSDDEINELDLDTMQPMSKKSTRISDFEDNHREQAYPENPDDFVSEILSDLNTEE